MQVDRIIESQDYFKKKNECQEHSVLCVSDLLTAFCVPFRTESEPYPKAEFLSEISYSATHETAITGQGMCLFLKVSTVFRSSFAYPVLVSAVRRVYAYTRTTSRT